MIRQGKKIINLVTQLKKDESFLKLIHWSENVISKVLSIALLVVIFVALVDLIFFLAEDIWKDPLGFYNKGLIELFGLFLNILIALELLENITAYLKKHIVQVELVIVTSLIAVARKIIIFDLKVYNSEDLMALGVAILSLSISYWLIKKSNN
ncbi:hypothetical protein Sta7437_2802 [Stanieria cyanosphaera PCC 7437]|uniref:Phosphate-starvation-inducible E-like protein n=1 Tax=Stanieria cyanosphaera (strain ATCC 29371 / PCC 7437) TaxID=111780 RepID=K9XW65_STAC7|nr:phosphate-starvation-inducible PsiE family protein [Stanieria cyanosphaera]AFZ36326.1 hypothetical protein Sta7437_2802 [Stanieria cyanosphaera PCC 7437]